MTLPAHRYSVEWPARARGYAAPEVRAATGAGSRTWVYDFDETITKAPEVLGRIAEGLKALGDRVVVVTGNQSPRATLVAELREYGFPFDELIQYQGDGSEGIRRAAILKELDAFGAFDDRVGRAATYAKVCPHLFLVAKPPKQVKQAAAGDAKKDAKQVVADQVSEERSAFQAVDEPEEGSNDDE